MDGLKIVSKQIALIFKHILKAVSSDSSRQILTLLHVDIDKGYICSADGYRVTFIKYDQTLELGLDNGNYKVSVGSINHLPLVNTELVTKETNNTTYPDLTKILHAPDLKPIVTIGIDIDLLKNLLAHADKMVIFKVYGKDENDVVVSPIEFQYTVNGISAFSMLMPMYADKNIKLWEPERSKKE